MLDVTIESDLTWSWKDEDELADIVALGMYRSDRKVKHIRAEAQRAIDDLEARRWPYDGGLRREAARGAVADARSAGRLAHPR